MRRQVVEAKKYYGFTTCLPRWCLWRMLQRTNVSMSHFASTAARQGRCTGVRCKAPTANVKRATQSLLKISGKRLHGGASSCAQVQRE